MGRARGSRVFNLYRPAASQAGGDPGQAGRWLDLVKRLYPDERAHIVAWLAHRVQIPGEKLNHALVLGGVPGIGKDSLLEPVVGAVGPWNVVNVRPMDTVADFNPFVKSVILRISEVRDLGDLERTAFYEHMKTYICAPPAVHMCNEKHLRQYAVPNVCGVVMTTNHEDALHLTPDDRRHLVCWSGAKASDWSKAKWDEYYTWLAGGGNAHVAAYLASYDLSKFNPKAPPEHTDAFKVMLRSNRRDSDSELSGAIEQLGNPDRSHLGGGAGGLGVPAPGREGARPQ